MLQQLQDDDEDENSLINNSNMEEMPDEEQQQILESLSTEALAAADEAEVVMNASNKENALKTNLLHQKPLNRTDFQSKLIEYQANRDGSRSKVLWALQFFNTERFNISF